MRVLLAGLVLTAAGACSAPGNDEQAIRQALDELEDAVENKSPGGVTALLAEDFSGPGGMNREGARALAGVLMARHSELGVTWTLESLEFQGDRATTHLKVVLSGKSLVPGLGARGRLMNVDLGWRRDGSSWEVVNAQWSGTFDRTP